MENGATRIDNLSRSARTFRHHLKQRFFLNEKALNWENLRIWYTHYKPKPAHDNVPNWQAYLEWYRQVVVEVLEIAEETGWRGVARSFAKERLAQEVAEQLYGNTQCN